jgi:cobalt/nickel transport system permease protein
MHIPDGYLSPSTCAVLFGAATPFWYVALRKLKRRMTGALVPKLSLVAAFSFVVMMFNLPLPGGTTGHATGAALAAIVLGPWAGMLAISLALFVQALFFGDGGVTAFGANSLNMAIVACLIASFVYRLIAGRAPLSSPRRIAAASLAGYVAINAAALLTAVEFGLQPIFFHDAVGAPLYAPYPLAIAIPAMMLGHLTFAGLAESFLTAGALAYLQRTSPEILNTYKPSPIRVPKRLWIGLASATLLTPLGLLAVGSAWGEWSAREFDDPVSRSKIMTTVLHAPLPNHSPAGLAKLSTLWEAPFSGYVVPVLPGVSVRYLLAAVTGAIVIVSVSTLAGSLFLRLRTNAASQRDD